MRILFVFMAIIASHPALAQGNLGKAPVSRSKFIFGVGLGAGTLSLNNNDTSNTSVSTTLPNIKLGYMVNPKLAVLAYLPGANYKYQKKDRGFEAMMLAGQYWIKPSWWVLGGMGMTFDAPAFYTVKDPKTAGFYTGFPALTAATGVEIWHKGKFAIDLQYRLFYGSSNLPNNATRKGLSNMLIVGFNWY